MADDQKIDILVNEKPVILEGSKQTGLTIKKAAIDQGVNIKSDFVLSVELGGGRTELIGDDQEIEVKLHDRFFAVEDKIDDQKIDILVNEKPVILEGSKQTGLTIKKAAIDQGVNIKSDFVLSVELGGGRTELIGDDQEIEVKLHDRFLAIENDDNS